MRNKSPNENHLNVRISMFQEKMNLIKQIINILLNGQGPYRKCVK